MLRIERNKFILINILKDIYTDKDLAPILGLKGGTACYLFYDLPRFSVDIDFNILEPEKENIVKQKIESIAKNYCRIKDVEKKKFTLFFLLSFEEKATNIKIEISKRRFPDSYEIKNYLGLSMLVMKREDMFAHKLSALLDRRSIANRDLFDLWYFFKNAWGINDTIIKERMGMDLVEYLSQCIDKVESVKPKYILQGLGELIEEDKKLWVKENLKKELVFFMKYYIAHSR